MMVLDKHLNGKSFLVKESLTLPDIGCSQVLQMAFQCVFDSSFQKTIKNVTAWFTKITSLPAYVKSAGSIKLCTVAQKPLGAKDEESAPLPTETTAAADDDLDLFGDDDEADAEAAKKIAAASKEKAKKKKKVTIAQSLVMFEVKPLDSDTDLDALAQEIFAIKMDGLYWKTQYKKEPVAFGIFKLIIGVTVEDEKVSVDGL